MIIKRPPPIQPKADPQKRDVFSVDGEVNRWGIKTIFHNGGIEQWIIDAKTGRPEKRNGYECMEANGFYLWIKKGEVLRSIDGLPYPSVWNK